MNLEAKDLKGISVIIPIFGCMQVWSNSVLSVYKQCLGRTNIPKVELILMNDNEEDISTSLLEQFIPDNYKSYITTRIIENRKKFKEITNYSKMGYNSPNLRDGHLYQGGARLKGMELASYRYCILLDCDDILAPNCIRFYWDYLQGWNNKENPYKDRELASLGTQLRTFDENQCYNDIGLQDNIPINSIWVQGRLWNKNVVEEAGITDDILYKNKLNRRQGEDYPFVNCFDYYVNHHLDNYVETQALFLCGFWIPNYNSLSRKDIYYAQHLAGSTMNSSISIYEYMRNYCNKHYNQVEDEELKIRLLNMNIYARYNLLDFIATISISHQFNKDNPYNPLEEDWLLLRDNTKFLWDKLRTYIREYNYSTIIDEENGIHHRSDCHYIEDWRMNIFDYLYKGDDEIFNMDFTSIMNYAKSLSFDPNNRLCLQSPQVQAYRKKWF